MHALLLFAFIKPAFRVNLAGNHIHTRAYKVRIMANQWVAS